MSSSRKRQSRLGRGLSSLMAQSVPATPPAAEESEKHSGDVSSAGDEDSSEARGGGEQVTDNATAVAAGTSASEGSVMTPPGVEGESSGYGEAEEGGYESTRLRYIPLDRLQPNPHQPRQSFDEDSLKRLAESIRADGLMQPIIARPADGTPKSDASQTFEIVAGERRWRAAALAGLTSVPTIVRQLDDRALAEWALIENPQREDLNPIERAEAFQRLAQRFELGHDEIARRVGLERSTISNLLRLLQLSDFVQEGVRDGRISMGQARAIAGLSETDLQRQLAEQAIKKGLSVRQVEQLVRQWNARQGNGNGEAANADEAPTGEPSRRQIRSAYLADLEQQLTEQLQTRVKVRPGRKKGSGTLTIEFYSLEEFDALLEKLGVSAD